MSNDLFGAAADHGALSGLLNGDPHTQYAFSSFGTLAARPAAGRSGVRYYATDTSTEYVTVNGAWVDPSVAYVKTAGGSTVTPASASTPGLVIKGASGQTSDLLTMQNNAGGVVASFDGAAGFSGIPWQSIGAAGYNNARLYVATGAAGNVGNVIKAAAGQTADLQQWQSSDTTVYGGMDDNGYAYGRARGSFARTFLFGSR